MDVSTEQASLPEAEASKSPGEDDIPLKETEKVSSEEFQVIEVCRICETSRNLLDISTDEFRYLNNKLHIIGDFEDKYDSCLKFICEICSYQLENAFYLKIKCQNTYNKLVTEVENEKHNDQKHDDPSSDTEELDSKYLDVFEVVETFDPDEYKNIDMPDIDDLLPYYLTEEPEQTIDDQDTESETEMATVTEIKPKKPPKPRTKLYVPQAMRKQVDKTIWGITRPKKLASDHRYICAHCGQSYKGRQAFMDHITHKHLKICRYQCDICGKKFVYNPSFYIHRKRHKCRICGKFQKPQNVKNNVDNLKKLDDSMFCDHIAAPVEERLPCHLCGKTLKTRASLSNHLHTHEESGAHHMRNKQCNKQCNKRFLCDICGYRSAAKLQLMEHMNIHLNLKNYKCDVCGKGFAQKIGLISHIKIHSGIKPFQCNYCPKTTLRKVHMRSHIMIHTGEKNYKCKVCGRAFNNFSSLKMHMRIHTGDTPFQCSFCSKKLMQKRSLQYHLKRCSKNNKKEEQINKNGDTEMKLDQLGPKDIEDVL